MRALDCSMGHDTIHFSAETDEELMQKVRDHAAQAHPELGEDQLREMFTQMVHDE